MLRKLIYSLLITIVFILSFSYLTSHLNFPACHRLRLRLLAGRQLLTSIFSLPIKSSVLSGHLKKPTPMPEAKETKVVARVGGYVLNQLTGWTSPFAEVTLTSQGLARKTTADGEGFFAFYYIPIPENLGELCLIAQDVNQLPSFPLCLAPPPKNMSLDINNVLLSPTISLESAQISTGKTAKASGMTFPNSEVEVYFFSENNFSLSAVVADFSPRFFQFLRKLKFATTTDSVIADFNLRPFLRKLKFATTIIKSAYAFSLPSYKIRSNQNGYFEFSLPSSSPSNNRVFVASRLSYLSDLSNLSSPKSNTLAFESIGFFGILLAFLKGLFRQAGAFFGSIKNNPFGIILIEAIILLGLLGAILVKKRKSGKSF